jgi:hypothetical protein
MGLCMILQPVAQKLLLLSFTTQVIISILHVAQLSAQVILQFLETFCCHFYFKIFLGSQEICKNSTEMYFHQHSM